MKKLFFNGVFPSQSKLEEDMHRFPSGTMVGLDVGTICGQSVDDFQHLVFSICIYRSFHAVKSHQAAKAVTLARSAVLDGSPL